METEKPQRLSCVKKFVNTGRDYTPARMLLSIQGAGLPLLGAMTALMGIANTGGRRVFYMALSASLAVLMLVAILLNVKGHYRISAGITAVMAIAAPWLCVLLDSAVATGNIMPLVFAALAIQLCSILFSLRVTVIVSALQLVALSVLIALTPRPAQRRLARPNYFYCVLSHAGHRDRHVEPATPGTDRKRPPNAQGERIAASGPGRARLSDRRL